MNTITQAGVTSLAMAAGFAAGGFIVERWDSGSDAKNAENQTIGHSAKIAAVVSSTAGVALIAAGQFFDDDSTSAFSGAGIPDWTF
jgi:hypothetical protein